MRFATDKISHGYLPAYLRIAAEIGICGRVCEVGVDRGGSLGMWQALFPAGLVAGVDRDPGAVWPPGTEQVISAQDDPELPGRLAAITPWWDLIVDDASHVGELTRKTWELLWPLVRPGGWYVIEDWMVGLPGSEWYREFGGSMAATAGSFLQLLARRDGELESAEYRYGLVILRKARQP